MTKDLTKGNIPKLLIGFFIFGRLFQQVYSVVDAAVVGRTLGVTALGGVPKYGFIAGCVSSLNYSAFRSNTRGVLRTPC